MAKFPTKETEIFSLCIKMAAGLRDNPLFPNPPAVWQFLNFKCISYQCRKNAEAIANARLEKAARQKKKALGNLANAIKANIRYAENTVNFDNDKLKLIGWSKRKKPHSAGLPAQPLNLKADMDDNFNITLSWEKGDGGGETGYYQIQKRMTGQTGWQNAASSVETYLILKEQNRNCGIEYIVYAVNKAGKSMPSNIAAVNFKQTE